MSTVAEIKSTRFPPQEYCELMALIHPFPDDDWDRQMKADAAAGRLDGMLERAKQDYAAGRTFPLEKLIEDES